MADGRMPAARVKTTTRDALVAQLRDRLTRTSSPRITIMIVLMLAGVGDMKTYLRDANDNIITIAMIETQTAMDNLDAIAAVPGIDVLFVGPSELSITLSKGAEFDPHSKTVEAANDKVLAACKKAGKIAGLYCATAERAVEVSKRGFRFCAGTNLRTAQR